MIWKCDICSQEVEKLKYLKKVKKKKYCQKCYVNNRNAFRKQTLLEDKKTKEKIIELEKKRKKESYHKHKVLKRPSKDYIYFTTNKKPQGIPKIKCQKENEKEKSYSYITSHERQILLKKLVNNGTEFEEAKEIINKLKEKLKETRKKMKEKGRSEEEILIKKNEILEGLHN